MVQDGKTAMDLAAERKQWRAVGLLLSWDVKGKLHNPAETMLTLDQVCAMCVRACAFVCVRVCVCVHVCMWERVHACGAHMRVYACVCIRCA